jgi:hypothetical protein
MFEVKKVIGANTEDGARWNPRTGGLVFEDDTGDMDRIGVKLRTRRDRVVPRLEAGDRRDNDIKGNLPCSGILGSGSYVDAISSSELEKFAELEAAFSDDGMIFFLLGVEISEICLGFGGRTEFR